MAFGPMIFLAFLLGATEIPEAQLVTQVDGKEVFAPAFRGNWAASATDCKRDSLTGIKITSDHIYGYEWDAVLLKTTPMIYQSAGSGGQETAYTVVVLMAGRSETDVDISKIRISRFGAKLYMSNVERVSEERRLTAEFANLHCP